MDEKERERNESDANATGFVIGSMFVLMFTSFYGISGCADQKRKVQEMKRFQPENAQMKYVNNDTLPDLVYKTGEIYFQRKDGRFESLDSVMKHENIKIDSIYRTKQDSIKNVYRNKYREKDEKLEKGVK
jgi:hypothetical protein